jgi:quinol monooxygenase YgiN
MKKSMKCSVLFCALGSLLFFGACQSGTKEKAAAEEESVVTVIVEDDEVSSADVLTIIANVTVAAEYKDELLTVFQTVVEATRLEAGNISYEVWEDTANPLRFTFIEKWKSQEAIDAHNASDHFQAFAKAIENKAALEVFILKQAY